MKHILLSGLLLLLTLTLSILSLSYFPLTENLPPREDAGIEETPSPTPPTPPVPPPEPSIYTELFLPTAEKYPAGDIARCPWDMAFYGGRLYFGSGDYYKNRGPAEIFSYDPATGRLEKSAVLPDEEASRFVLLNGRLAVPGTDPTEAWSSDAPFYGSYYVLTGDTWVQKQVLPGAIHNFDLIAYGDCIFAGLGVVPGNSPIAVSTDGGESFSAVPLYKNGVPLDTSDLELVRTHDFILCGDTLYATLYATYPEKTQPPRYELYVYDGDAAHFRYAASLDGIIEHLAYSHVQIGEKIAYGGRLFFNTGYLYETAEMTVFEKIAVSGAKIVTDLFLSDGTLYLLGSARERESGRFRTTVYAMEEDGSASLLFDFLYDVPAMSLAVTGNDFYIGMGDGNNAHEKNGAILQVTLPLAADEEASSPES